LTAELSLRVFGTWTVAEVRLRLDDLTITVRGRSLCFADEWGAGPEALGHEAARTIAE
jgi:hypothetical protein